VTPDAYHWPGAPRPRIGAGRGPASSFKTAPSSTPGPITCGVWRQDFRPQDGRTVNLAARISDYARPGEVLVSDEVAAARKLEAIRYEPVGAVSLKGLTDPVTLYSACAAAILVVLLTVGVDFHR
jgi:Adenylate and Guanylate cyclase catalytic domain